MYLHFNESMTMGQEERLDDSSSPSRTPRRFAKVVFHCTISRWSDGITSRHQTSSMTSKAINLPLINVTFDEAVECFFSDFHIRKNKRYKDRYQLIGATFGGRKLKIIFQLKAGKVVRIITGWRL
jgi:uncharacterized DUF497 family protein